MTSVSLLPALQYARSATTTFRQAATAVLSNDLAGAIDLLGSIDDSLLRSHFDAAVEAATPRLAASGHSVPATNEKTDRFELRMPGAAEVREIFQNDGWRCRWCSTPVIRVEALKAMARRCPDHFPHGKRNADRHGITLCCAASVDHVVPHSFGGTNDRTNLVTACWPCQFGRGNVPIEALGLLDPRQRLPVVDDWDGCAWFR